MDEEKEFPEVFMHKNGILPDIEPHRGILIGDIGMNIDNLKPIKGIMPAFNQYLDEKTASGCTFVNSFRDRCYVTGVNPHAFDFTNLIDYAAKYYGYKIGSGWRTESAMNIVQKRTRIHRPQYKCNYFKVRWDDPDTEKLLDKGYVVGVTYSGNSAYNRDYQSDCVLNGCSFGEPTYGHRTSMKKEGAYFIDDSYAGKIFNKYQLKQQKKLFQNGTYNPRVWVWIMDPPMNEEEVKRLVKLRTACLNANDQISIAKSISNSDVTYKNACQSMIDSNNKKINTINEMLKSNNTSGDI